MLPPQPKELQSLSCDALIPNISHDSLISSSNSLLHFNGVFFKMSSSRVRMIVSTTKMRLLSRYLEHHVDTTL